MPRKLAVEIVADAAGLRRELGQAESRLERFGKVAKVAGLALAGGLAVGLEKSTKAAIGAEAQTQALDQALRNAHIGVKSFAGSLESAEQRGRKFGFSNNEVREALTKLVTATRDSKKATTDLAVAEDLARFKHTTLQQASDTLTRSIAGSSRALKQLGIDVPAVTSHMDALRLSHMKTGTAAYFLAEAHAKAADKAATAAARMSELNDRLHGQADAFSHTAAGGLAKYHAAMENLQELIGQALLPVVSKLANFIADLTDRVSQSQRAQDAIAKVSQVLKGVWEVVAETVRKLSQTIMAHRDELAKLANFLNETLVPVVRFVLVTVLPAAVGVAITAIGLLISALSKIIHATQAVVVEVRDDVAAIVGFFRDMPGRIGAAISAGASAIKNAITGLFGKVIGWVKDVLGIGSPSQVFHEIGVNVIRGFVGGIGSMAGALEHAVKSMVTGLLSKLNPFGGTPGGGRQGFGPAAYAGIPTRAGVDLADEQPQVLRALRYAMGHGWHGEVTSGFRTYAEQAALYQRYLHGGPLAAAPGTSSHERGEAVDVTDYGTFARIMANAPSSERLYNHLGARDPVHFSVSGYDQGGVLPPGLTLAVNKTGRPELVLPIDPSELDVPGLYTGGDEIHALVSQVHNAFPQPEMTAIGTTAAAAVAAGVNDNATTILGAFQDAKQGVDDWANSAGVANMTGVGQNLSTALVTGFRSGLAGPSFIGGQAAAAAIGAQTTGYLGGGLHIHLDGPVYADDRGIRELADKVHSALLDKQRGNVTLGFK